MGQADYYKHGSHNVQCDRCGFKYKAHQTKMEWNGLRTCSGSGTNQCWEPRHPQDLIKGKADKQSVPNPRPESEDDFLATNEVSEGDL